MTTTREVDWLGLMVQSDPEFNQKASDFIEYRFTAKTFNGDRRKYDEGQRVFRGDYRTRGPYAD